MERLRAVPSRDLRGRQEGSLEVHDGRHLRGEVLRGLPHDGGLPAPRLPAVPYQARSMRPGSRMRIARRVSLTLVVATSVWLASGELASVPLFSLPEARA